MADEYIKKLVIARLRAIPPDVSLSIGDFGKFNSEQLIAEVEKESPIGQYTIQLQLKAIRQTANINEWLSHE